MSDDFEAAGTTANPAIWPLTTSTHVESGLAWFGSTNRYLRLTGGGTRCLSASWGAQLNGRTSTFAFDYYEPSTSSNSLTLGYSAGNADINTAEAFARIALTGGIISMSSTTGTVVTATGILSYPRDRRLTFSLALNHTNVALPFNGGSLAAKALDVWYYDWVTGQKIYVLTIDVTNSPRTPLRVGFRTFSAETGVQAYFDNVKLLDALTVLTPGFVPTTGPIVPPRPFVHPSVLNSGQDLDRIKYRIKYEPASAARLGWNQMTNTSYAKLSYQHSPTNVVVVKGSGTTPTETQFRNDGQAAYAHALEWALTGNTQNRDKALAILNDWSATFVMLSPDVGTSPNQLHLEAAWYLPVLVAAADILRYYNNGAAGWSSNDIARCDVMLNYLYGQAALAASMENNWGASAALAMIATGVYQEDRSRFDAGIQTWRDRFTGINALVDSYNDDSIYEVCRDVTHPQYTLQVWQQAAEIAWKHNVDLYSMTLDGTGAPQFARNLEYFGQLFMGLRTNPCDATFNATYSYPGTQDQSGAYDIAHNHYINRSGSNMIPVYADMVVNHWRPGGFDSHFIGWSTLTHGDLSVGIPVIGGLLLTNSSLGTNRPPLADGDTINLRDFTAVGWKIAPQLAGTTSWVQYYTNGTPFLPAVSNAPFAAASLPRPGNHFLSAVPWKTMPSGAIPGDEFLRFVRVIDLTTNWQLHDIGAPAVPSWAAETNNALTLSGPGAGVAGTSDQFGFVAAEINGDVQITARLMSVEAVTNTARAGIMVRDGSLPGSKHVLLSTSAAGAMSLRYRAADSGASADAASSALPAPRWLRLTRFGDVFTAYVSVDGTSWTSFGSATVPMNSNVQVGLAAASGLGNKTARADFQNVLVEPLSADYAQWQNWLFTRRGVTDPALTAANADPDHDSRPNIAEYLLGSDPLAAQQSPPVRPLNPANGQIVLRIAERKNAAALGRTFLYSTNLSNWTPITPISLTTVEDDGAVVVRDAGFPASGGKGFYRISY